MDRVPPSKTEMVRDAANAPASRADAGRASAENGRENGSDNGQTSVAGDDGTSLVTTPATRRKPRAKKTSTATAEKPRRASRKKKAAPPASVPAVPSAPLTRPDGTPAPVVHLAPELSPYARTGGLGEAVASLARYQSASGIPVTVIMALFAAVRFIL